MRVNSISSNGRDETVSGQAVGYLRRSSDMQDRSIEDQRAAVIAFADSRDLEVTRFYVDDAISGISTSRRDAFKEMLAAASLKPRPFDFIIVYDVKRFGRMDNDETGYYRHILRKKGVTVLYTSEGFTETHLDDLIRPVKQWQARQESRDLAQVVVRGHLSKSQQDGGGWWIAGVPSHGYDRRYEDARSEFLFVVRNMMDRSKVLFDGIWPVKSCLSAAE